jgi:cysteine-rich repeat protein
LVTTTPPPRLGGLRAHIYLAGADPSNHGKTVLIDNSIQFAVAGQGTGFYFALSQMYDQIAVSNVPALSYFGNFTVEGQLSCYDKVHIEASSPAINTLTDAYLSNWGCSVHEAFSNFPSTGLLGFETIAIADGVVAPGTLSYADGHSGLPYIITRGATPSGCGDGVWQSQYGEECDDGSKNGTPGDPCSISCKCLSGLPKGDGTCYSANSTVSSAPSTGGATGVASGSPKPSGYFNSSTIA